MALSGQAKTEYMRDYMRRVRAGKKPSKMARTKEALAKARKEITALKAELARKMG